MKRTLPFLNHDAQDSGPQYLEDLATGYWFSEVLFAAVEMDLFSLLEPKGATPQQLAGAINADPRSLQRFLQALGAIGLVTNHGSRYFNTRLSSNYLVNGRADYQGDSILWRKYLDPKWKRLSECLRKGGRVDYAGRESRFERTHRIRRYIHAMDNVAGIKGKEILRFFEGLPIKGKILDVGAGSGALTAAFLGRFPLASATLLDLSDVLECAREMMRGKTCAERIHYCPANILERWPVRKRGYDMVILSNILHAYSRRQLPDLLRSASACLKKKGVLLVHDFFLEHYPEKAALTDLNMFINTFNGTVFSGKAVRKELGRLGLFCTDPISLKTDTAVLFAAREEATLQSLHIDPTHLLVSRILAAGFRGVHRVKTSDIHISRGSDLRCRFGCDRYGSPHCPPNSPTSRKTKGILKSYRHALLLEGEPPTKAFQLRVLEAEREAFRAGFYKAFAYWAGPCSLCGTCTEGGKCRNTRDARPSMEGAGIDVFETVRQAGLGLRTLDRRDDYVKYFGLLLLE